MEQVYSFFRIELQDTIATVYLLNSEKHHALSMHFWKELPALIQALSQQDVRVLILKSDGPVFSKGIDLHLMNELLPYADTRNNTARKRARIYHHIKYLQHSINMLETAPFVTLVGIQGPCIGSAVSLVTACDLRYCLDVASFKIQETALGLMADLGALQRLPYQLPEAILNEMAFTSRALFAEEAFQYGFVNEVFEDPTDLDLKLESVAEQIASYSPMVLWSIKESLIKRKQKQVSDGLDRAAIWNAGMVSRQDVLSSFESELQNIQAKYRSMQDLV